ncbi:ATP-dependent 3'-5' DNA helicase [Coemansia sp. RSA 2598]|nr:ATP-dependent 3'-5' DNA helicase [Coemansia sp. RSA 2598]
MRQLTHTPDPLAIDSDGSAHGTRYLVAWKARPANKQQPFGDPVLVAGHLLRNNMRTLLFCKTRGICELLYMDLQRYIDSDPELAAYRRKVMNYRGGYTPRERREIESALFAGLTSLVVCTNALELGINVGSLDCIVMHGLPYSASSMWQQIGRAGRLMQDSLAIVMLTNDPVDTYAMKAPSLLFQRLPEHLLIASETSITHAHLQCAAFDKPIDPDNSRDQEFIASLGASSALLKSSLLWDAVMKRYLCKLRYKPWPAQRVMIRRSGNSTDEWKVLLLPSLRLLEDLDPMHALFSLYEGGIFLHRGHTYSIDKVDPDARVALVSQTSVSWYTRKRDYREVRPLDTQLSVAVDPGQSRDQCRNQRPDQSLDRCLDSERSASTMPLCALYGRVEIITRVFGYHRVDMQSKKIVETVDHSSPELRSESLGIWIDVPLSICHRLSQGTHDVEASIHAVQHLMIRCIGRLAMGPAAVEDELDTECKSPLATRTRIPRLVVYEKHPVLDTSICDVNGTHAGMGGLAARSLRQISEIMCNALMVVDTCDCKDAPAGCTGCVELRAGCSENNQCLDKQGARLLLQLLLSRDPTLAVDAG